MPGQLFAAQQQQQQRTSSHPLSFTCIHSLRFSTLTTMKISIAVLLVLAALGAGDASQHAVGHLRGLDKDKSCDWNRSDFVVRYREGEAQFEYKGDTIQYDVRKGPGTPTGTLWVEVRSRGLLKLSPTGTTGENTEDFSIKVDGQGVHDDSDEATFAPYVFTEFDGHACVEKFVHGIITITLDTERNKQLHDDYGYPYTAEVKMWYHHKKEPEKPVENTSDQPLVVTKLD